jgi:hypothetical protein
MDALNEVVLFDNSTYGYGALGIQVTGTWVGTITFQSSTDGTNFDTQTVSTLTGTTATTTTANGQWRINTGGAQKFQVKMTAYTSGSATATLFATPARAPFDVITQPASTTWVVREDDHQRIHSGTSYHYSDDFTLNSGAVRYYEVVADTKTAHAILGLISNGEVELYLFESPTITTVTTTFNIRNRNRASANATGYTLKLATVVSAEGTELMDLHMGLSTGSSTSVQLQRGQEWILKASTTYLIKIQSNSNNNDITFMLDFYHTS